MKRPPTTQEISRRLLRAPRNAQRDAAIQRTIRQIPAGKVATYAQVAAAAGYPLYHRQVVQVLRKAGDRLKWHRVVERGGKICVKLDSAQEQRLRLEMEGVHFRGARVIMGDHQHQFRGWEFD